MFLGCGGSSEVSWLLLLQRRLFSQHLVTGMDLHPLDHDLRVCLFNQALGIDLAHSRQELQFRPQNR